MKKLMEYAMRGHASFSRGNNPFVKSMSDARELFSAKLEHYRSLGKDDVLEI